METQRKVDFCKFGLDCERVPTKTDFPVFAVDSEDAPGIVAAPRRLRFGQTPGWGSRAGQGRPGRTGPDRAAEDCVREKTACQKTACAASVPQLNGSATSRYTSR